MQQIPPITQQFDHTQVIGSVVTTWDTPFVCLEGGIASGGMLLNVLNPLQDGTWGMPAFIATAAPNTDIRAAFVGATGTFPSVVNGRTDVLVKYWAGGAPADWGCTVDAQLAVHFSGVMRTQAARNWFSPSTTPTWFLAMGGSGWARVDQTIGGTTTTLFNGNLTEQDFLVSGMAMTPTISNMTTGDRLDIYYVQRGTENFGGFVFKAVPVGRSTPAADIIAARNAPILGCDLFDDGNPPQPQVLSYVESVDVEWKKGQATRATFKLPLLNPQVHDGVGYLLLKSSDSDPGVLQQWTNGQAVYGVKHNRLVQVEFVFSDGVGGATEPYTVFTGFIDDFQKAADGLPEVTCTDMRYRLLQQSDKSYPDKISYIARNYKALSGTSQPVYGLAAYDNWSMEFALADLFARAGIPAARMTQPLTVPRSTGVPAPVVIGSDTFLKFRARTVSGLVLQLDRPVHFGNAGVEFDEAVPADDPYIFAPVNTQELWNRVNTIATRYGYDVGFDEVGDVILKPRNNPCAVFDVLTGDVTGGTAIQNTNPSAFAGTYIQCSGAASVSKIVTGARIDVSLPRGPGNGAWQFTITNSSSVVVANITASPNDDITAFYYDEVSNSDGNNATIVTLYSGDFDTYTVVGTLIAGTGSGGTGVAIVPSGAYLNAPIASLVGATSFAFKVHMLVDQFLDSSAWQFDVLTIGSTIGGNTTQHGIAGDGLGNFHLLSTMPDGFAFGGPEYPATHLQSTLPGAGTFVTFYGFWDSTAGSGGQEGYYLLGDTGTVYAGSTRSGAGALPMLGVLGALNNLMLGNFPAAGLGTVAGLKGVDGVALYVAKTGTAQLTGAAQYSAPTLGDAHLVYLNTMDDASLTAQLGAPMTLIPVGSPPFPALAVAEGGSWGPTSAGTGNGLIDCFFTYHTDPVVPRVVPLSTAQNALKVDTVGGSPDQRNLVIVVGRVKAALTDSAKLNNNPENPEGEYIVASAVDVDSITNPLAPNFVGFRKEAVIYDNTITDLDFAQWTALTFIQRQRLPKPYAPITHTLLPAVQLRDPVYGVEATYNSITADTVLFVTGVRHKWVAKHGSAGGDGIATTTLDTTSYPEFPAYEPREPIDIDALFGGKPVVNVQVQYTSLTGTLQTNLGLPSAAIVTSGDADIVTATVAPTTGTPPYLDLTGNPWPPVPGTVFVKAVAIGSDSLTTTVVNTAGMTDASADGVLGARIPDSNRSVTPSGGLSLPGCFAVLQVNVTSYTTGGFGNTQVFPTLWANISQTRTASAPYYYVFDPATLTLTVYAFRRPGVNADNNLFITAATVEVVFEQVANGVLPGYLTNNPYHHLLNVDFRTTNPRVYLPWVHGDGGAPYQLPAGVTDYQVLYRRLGKTPGNFVDPYSGASPFFDPYTSEIGFLINLQFDALVTGNYRISVRSLQTNDVVAYLTEPTADPTVPDSHWTYIVAGANQQFAWDGVDNVGFWNQEQSQVYAAAAQGAFEKGDSPIIGSGFYAWNREIVNGLPGDLALISGDLDPDTGRPVFGLGTYSAWYIQVEAVNDNLQAIADANPGVASKQVPRHIETYDPSVVYTEGATSAIAYTHISKPPEVDIVHADWVGSAFDPTNDAALNTTANWGAADADATINNAKPIRLRFKVQPRPGILWSTHEDEVNVKLTRHVHLRAHIFDQFVTWAGGNYPNSSTPQRTIASRRLVNDTNTITYVDSDYRLSGSFKQVDGGTGTEWIFYPSLFAKNFTGTDNEPIQFGDYLQLEEVPSYDPNRSVDGSSSRLQFALMSYLWYLSCYVQDRSGRFAWCVDPGFVDTSKVLLNNVADWWGTGTPTVAATTSTFRVDPLDDPFHQFRRSIFTRQWTDEPGFAAAQATQFGLTSPIALALQKHHWKDHDPQSTTIAGVAWPTLNQDDYSRWHTQHGLLDLAHFPVSAINRQLGAFTAGAPTTELGLWTWEMTPLWLPNISRDFHPYYQLPPMVDKDYTLNLEDVYFYTEVDYRPYSTDGKTETGDDTAASATWGSPVWDATQPFDSSNGSVKRFWVGRVVNTSADPTKNIGANTCDYIRQDDSVHYEDLRGLISRGPKPAFQPIKVTPVQPYYVNAMAYDRIDWVPARNNPSYPHFFARVTNYFDLKFRKQYVWESGTLFPTDQMGRELLSAMNVELLRSNTNSIYSVVRYDSGAWVGWKDDIPSPGGVTDPAYKLYYGVGPGNTNVQEQQPLKYNRAGSIFETGQMPAAVGPRLPQTIDLYMHLVLVDERRDESIF